MTDEELIKVHEEMVKMFGWLPNPEHYPKMFAHYIKVYKYYKGQKQ